MTRKVPWLSAVAFVFGAVLIHLYLERLERERSGGAPVPVLTAARDLKPGDVLTEKDVSTRPIPQDYAGARSIRGKELGEAVGRQLVNALTAGDGLLWTDLLGSDRTPRQLSELVTEGMRGVTITSRTQLFEGLLRPGDRVDVLLTVLGGAEPATYTLLQNVRILSVGGTLGEAEGDTRLGSTSVNVSVSIVDAQRLAEAEERGRLSLVLRNPKDAHIEPASALPETPVRPAPPVRRLRKEIEHVR